MDWVEAAETPVEEVVEEMETGIEVWEEKVKEREAEVLVARLVVEGSG